MNSNQTVVQTYNKTTYLNCTTDYSDNGTFVYNGGSRGFREALTFIVPLTIAGLNYFFSDAGGGVQCQRSLAFEIDVQRGLGLPPSLNQPSYQEPPGPDATQSLPTLPHKPFSFPHRAPSIKKMSPAEMQLR